MKMKSKKIKSRPHEIDYYFIITKTIQNKKIIGYVIPSWDTSLDKLKIEFTFNPLAVRDWTKVTIKFIEPRFTKKEQWWAIAPLGVIPLIKLFENNLVNMPQAYAANSAMPIMPSEPSSVVIGTSITIKSILTSKTVIASILATVIVTGGIVGPYSLDPTIFGNSLSDNISSHTVSSSQSELSNDVTATPQPSSISSNSESSSLSAQPSTKSVNTAESPPQETIIQSLENDIQTLHIEKSQTKTSVSSGSSHSFTDSSSVSAPSKESDSFSTPPPLSDRIPIKFGTSDIQIDKSGNIWVPEKDYNQVRKMNSNGDNIFVIGGNNQENTVVPTNYYDSSSQRLSTLFMMPLAFADNNDSITLHKPTSLAIDNFPLENDTENDTVHVYIVDSGNKRIIKVDQDGKHMPDFVLDCNDDQPPKICEFVDDNFDLRIAADNGLFVCLFLNN